MGWGRRCVTYLLPILLSLVSSENLTLPSGYKSHFVVGGLLSVQTDQELFRAYAPTFQEHLNRVVGPKFSPRVNFSFVPLDAKTMFSKVQNGSIDFVFASPSVYGCLEWEYSGLTPLVTQVALTQGHALAEFGGVIFTRGDNREIKRLEDLYSRKLAAASLSDVGSGLSQWMEMETETDMEKMNQFSPLEMASADAEFGVEAPSVSLSALGPLSLIQAPSQVIFTGSQDDVVKLVGAGLIDVGLVQTGHIEGMQSRGDQMFNGTAINKSMFKYINAKTRHLKNGTVFPFQSSTSLYPEWTVASTRNVPAILSKAVLDALFDITPNSTQARSGSYFGWQQHLGNAPVIKMLQGLGIMTKNDGGVWRCKGAVQTNLHDSIVCPEGSFIKTRSGVEAGCSVFGMNCTLNGKKYSECLCRPCVFRDEVEIFNSGMDDVGPSNIDRAIEQMKKDIIDHDRREQQDSGLKTMSILDAMSSSTPPDDMLFNTSEEGGSFPVGEETQQTSVPAKLGTTTSVGYEVLPPLLCSQFDVCLPGVQQRSMSPLLVKDHLMRRPGSANFRAMFARFGELEGSMEVGMQHFMTTESGVWYTIPSDFNTFMYTGMHQIKIALDLTEIPNSPILLQVNPRRCDLDFKDDHMLRVPNSQGICVCNSDAIELGSGCFAISNLLLATLMPFGAIVAIVAAALYAFHKRKVDAIWSMNPAELKFHIPPVILGRGSFGLVVLGEYRGTSVAVKRVLPQQASGINANDSMARLSGGDPSWEHHSPFTDIALGDAAGDELGQTGSSVPENDGTNVAHSSSPIDSLSPGTSAFRSSWRSRFAGSLGWMRVGSRSVSGNTGTSSNAILPTGDFATASDFRKQTKRPVFGSQVGLRSSNLLSFGRESPLVAFFLGKGYQAKRKVAGLKRDFIEEMRIVSKLRHPSVTTVMGAVLGKEPMLVMEYMTLGSLYDILMNESYPFESDVLLYMLRDVVQGMRFLHTADPPIVHGDLKAANVLITENFKAKVADFGLSQKKRLGNVGTPLWMAPELLNWEVSTPESDVYAFSIMLVEIFSRTDPYEGMDPHMVLEAVKDVNRQVVMRPSLPAGLLPEVELMIKDCWHNDPEKRPPFVELDRRVKAFDALQLQSSKILLAGAAENERQAMAQNVLFDVFPQHIAEALVAGRKPQAEKKEVVTIFFSDIVGFTDISSKLEPLKVSQMLDRLYTEFDALAEKHHVYKVETIGDAYMAVTNLVADQGGDHASRIARFSLEAVAAANSVLIDEENPGMGHINIRVGFHSGPVVANVVGTKCPRYCLFGDTVNTASRMESYSEKNKINISRAAASYVLKQAPDIVLKKRGAINIKGKGVMSCYWVCEEKVGDAAGRQPRQGGWEQGGAGVFNAVQGSSARDIISRLPSDESIAVDNSLHRGPEPLLMRNSSPSRPSRTHLQAFSPKEGASKSANSSFKGARGDNGVDHTGTNTTGTGATSNLLELESSGPPPTQMSSPDLNAPLSGT